MKRLIVLLLLAVSISSATDSKDVLKRALAGKWDSLRDDGWFLQFARNDIMTSVFLSQVQHTDTGLTTYTTSVSSNPYEFQGPRLIFKSEPSSTYRLIATADVLYLNNLPTEFWQSFVRCPPAPCDLRRLPIPPAAQKALTDAKPIFEKYKDQVLKNE